jgi:hypothetical protein
MAAASISPAGEAGRAQAVQLSPKPKTVDHAFRGGSASRCALRPPGIATQCPGEAHFRLQGAADSGTLIAKCLRIEVLGFIRDHAQDLPTLARFAVAMAIIVGVPPFCRRVRLSRVRVAADLAAAPPREVSSTKQGRPVIVHSYHPARPTPFSLFATQPQKATFPPNAWLEYSVMPLDPG